AQRVTPFRMNSISTCLAVFAAFAVLQCAAPAADEPSSSAESPVVAPTAVFHDVYQAALSGACQNCHTSAHGNAGELNLENEDTAYTNLVRVNARGRVCASRTNVLVVPNQPDSSLLAQKLKGTQMCGARMPKGNAAPLSNANIAMVVDWIQGGAL